MVSEREVRTRAGWIGVEISKSRVRRADRPGYGLWRVRGLYDQMVSRTVVRPGISETSEPYWAPSVWTGYLFTLEEIDTEISVAIEAGTPARPKHMFLRPARPVEGVPLGRERFVLVTVPTRWTSRYRGRRDLGVDAQ